jgi:flavin reductase (DIM6/NTAB) family NADH-FMN oxidoreductase RutF/DNA-binding IclR family transcriptional regulator
VALFVERPRPIDARSFREVLGQYPTGVCVVAALDPELGPVGMAVGSFTSVSLDPPLVAFLADESSTTWPLIRKAGSFCVNVLAAGQEHVCRAFAVSGGDKFGDLRWNSAGTLSPVIDGCIAWIDCEIDHVHRAGDHDIVIGRVRELDIGEPSLPLVFFQGGYGRFLPQSLVAGDEEFLGHLRRVDLIRHELERLASDSELEANVSVRIRDEVVVLATAGRPRGRHAPSRVGHRYAMVPPVGAVFVAWADLETIEAWASTEDYRAALATVRANGYSLLTGWIADEQRPGGPPGKPGSSRNLSLVVQELRIARGTDDFELPDGARFWATISVPAFDSEGRVSMLINLNGFDAPLGREELEKHVERLVATAQRVTSSAR